MSHQPSPGFWMDLRQRFQAWAGNSTPVWAKRTMKHDWIVGGGRDSETLALVRATIAQAAAAAGMQGERETEWLNAIVGGQAQIVSGDARSIFPLTLDPDIPDVAAASVLLVTELETQSLARREKPSREPHSARAAWLKDLMKTRGLTPWSIENKLSGPDKKTITRILEGGGVREESLELLACVLQIDRADIPNA